MVRRVATAAALELPELSELPPLLCASEQSSESDESEPDASEDESLLPAPPLPLESLLSSEPLLELLCLRRRRRRARSTLATYSDDAMLAVPSPRQLPSPPPSSSEECTSSPKSSKFNVR